MVASERAAAETAAAGAGEASRGPSNIVLVSMDTLRADHLGCYGYPRATSPRIDAFAGEGARFEKAYSPSAWTLPAHASMLTGVSPFRHGAVDWRLPILEDVPTIAEILHGRGYATVAVVAAPALGTKYGFARGFDRYLERFQQPRDPKAYQALVLETVSSLGKEPFFLFLHYMNAHSPYKPPPEFDRFGDPNKHAFGETERVRRLQRQLASGKPVSKETRADLVDLYDGQVLGVDHTFGELFDALRTKAPANTLIVLTADHGEEFLEHGGLVHGRTLYDEILHVPLVMVGPGVRPQTSVSQMVSLLDIVPTILDWAAAPAPENLEGHSLRTSLAGGSAGADYLLPLHTRVESLAGRAAHHLSGLRTPTAKLIVDDATGSKEYYDLTSDPKERKNIYPRPEADRLESILSGLQVRPPLRQAAPPGEEEIKTLKSLGYL